MTTATAGANVPEKKTAKGSYEQQRHEQRQQPAVGEYGHVASNCARMIGDVDQSAEEQSDKATFPAHHAQIAPAHQHRMQPSQP